MIPVKILKMQVLSPLLLGHKVYVWLSLPIFVLYYMNSQFPRSV